jgi:hypothetical protein
MDVRAAATRDADTCPHYSSPLKLRARTRRTCSPAFPFPVSNIR